jgi:hypothetical protein
VKVKIKCNTFSKVYTIIFVMKMLKLVFCNVLSPILQVISFIISLDKSVHLDQYNKHNLKFDY